MVIRQTSCVRRFLIYLGVALAFSFPLFIDMRRDNEQSDKQRSLFLFPLIDRTSFQVDLILNMLMVPNRDVIRQDHKRRILGLYLMVESFCLSAKSALCITRVVFHFSILTSFRSGGDRRLQGVLGIELRNVSPSVASRVQGEPSGAMPRVM